MLDHTDLKSLLRDPDLLDQVEPVPVVSLRRGLVPVGVHLPNLTPRAGAATYGDTRHTLVDRSRYNGPYLPGYVARTSTYAKRAGAPKRRLVIALALFLPGLWFGGSFWFGSESETGGIAAYGGIVEACLERL